MLTLKTDDCSVQIATVILAITIRAIVLLYGWHGKIPMDTLLPMAFLIEADFYMLIAIHTTASISWFYGIYVSYINIMISLKIC